MTATRYIDAAFSKYAQAGAYHWREVGPGLLAHNAFTAERYRRVIDLADLTPGQRVLDYGCGDAALLGVLHRRFRARLELHGFDPNVQALVLAEAMLSARRIRVTLHGRAAALPPAYFDRILCTEVIEHAAAPDDLLASIDRALAPGGRAVLTTPVRLTEQPEDPNHAREWFFDEFAGVLARHFRIVAHHQVIPASAPEVYYWRPRFFARVPVFRLACNVLSFGFGVNALSWLRMRPRLFMLQIAVVEKHG